MPIHKKNDHLRRSRLISQAGGWSNTRRSCIYRKTIRSASSNHMEKVLVFTGILSNKANENSGLLSRTISYELLSFSCSD
ncbi:unnamed protein product [Eruca vesicaria subsp. sativa]|uniref:Pectin acetylesterase n=1 Tax=Eruca vesicaria subsp. sativa TaxID=29727 RepID=A0ABC8K9N4_ERUVS|nr:unnamed protein product [Eruca vesicaria subsp. sativa]